MGAAQARSVRLRRTAVLLASCTALTSCAIGSDAPSDDTGLFKAEVGDISGGIGPGPHSVWYAERSPDRYVKMGFATWRAPRPVHGLRAWLSRLIGRQADAAPLAVASSRLGLPVPSMVQVVNVTTGAAVMVRIDDKTHMGDSVVRLPPDVAKALEADPSKPLLVRLRYMAPVVAYREPPTLRYALLGAPRRSEPTLVAAQASPPPPTAPPVLTAAASPLRRTPAPPRLIHVADNAPLRASALRPALAAEPPSTEPTQTVHGFTIQAGAFAKRVNAEHAVSMLSPAGDAVIIPIRRGALKLYRVVLQGPRTAAAAETLRARVAQIGFRDAEVIRPL